MNTSLGLRWPELISTLGHELGHAALYDNFFLARPDLPAFINPSWNDPTDPGGIRDFGIHYGVWGLMATQLFK